MFRVFILLDLHKKKKKYKFKFYFSIFIHFLSFTFLIFSHFGRLLGIDPAYRDIISSAGSCVSR